VRCTCKLFYHCRDEVGFIAWLQRNDTHDLPKGKVFRACIPYPKEIGVLRPTI